MMKLQVTVQVQAKMGNKSVLAPTRTTVRASPGDSVGSVKQRLELVEPMVAAYMKNTVVAYDGWVLGDEERLDDCEVKDGSALDFTVRVSSEALAQQLEQLLQARAAGASSTPEVSVTELSLMFCHRHGITVDKVLEAVGYNGAKLGDFLEDHKGFKVTDGQVGLIDKPMQSEPALPKIPEADPQRDACVRNVDAIRIKVLLCVRPPGQVAPPDAVADIDSNEAVDTIEEAFVRRDDNVQAFKSRFAEMASVPFASHELFANGRMLCDSERLQEFIMERDVRSLIFVVQASEGDLARQLMRILLTRPRRASSPDELGLLYSCMYGAPVKRALKLLGCKEKFRDFLQRRKEFTVDQGCVWLTSTQEVESAKVLDSMVAAASFLNIDRDLRNPTGNGVTLFLAGAWPADTNWQAGLLQAVAGAVRDNACRDNCTALENVTIHVADGAVQAYGVDGVMLAECRLAAAVASN